MAKGKEIEQRWLVRSMDESVFVHASTQRIAQGYLPNASRGSLRIRVVDRRKAVLGLKNGQGEVRDQAEEEVSLAAAELLFEACYGRLDKTRQVMDDWELDAFGSPFNGLRLLERERRPDEPRSAPPDWVRESVEVTDILNNEFLVRLASSLKEGSSPAQIEERSQAASLRERRAVFVVGGTWQERATAYRRLRTDFSGELFCVPDIAGEMTRGSAEGASPVSVQEALLTETKRLAPEPGPIVVFADCWRACFGRLVERLFDYERARNRLVVVLDRATLDVIKHQGDVLPEKSYAREYGIHSMHEAETLELRMAGLPKLVRKFLDGTSR